MIVCVHACLFPITFLMCAVLLRECTLDFYFFPPVDQQFGGEKKINYCGAERQATNQRFGFTG